MSKQRSALCSVFIVVLTTTALADTGSDYRRAQRYMTRHAFSQTLNTSVLHANTTLPPAPAHPAQQTYYNHPESIHKAAASHVASAHTVGNLVQHSALTRPKMQVNPNSPEVKFSQKVQKNAKAISDGTYKDCNKKTITEITYTNKTCSTGLPFQFDCVKSLGVKVQEKEVTKNENLSLPGPIRMTGASRAYLPLSPEKGFVTGFSMHVRDGANPWSCFQTYYLQINGITIGAYHGQCHKQLGDLQFSRGGIKIPFSHHSVTFTLIGGRLSGYVSGSLSFSYLAKEKEATKTWQSSCASIPRSCHVNKTRCVEAGRTKTIDGVPVSADCWKENVSYQCGSPMSSECNALENAGCTQVSSQCSQQDAGVCERYAQTWSCPDKKTIGSGIQCGERFYCMDGTCQPTHQEKNKDFGKSVTELDAVASAGQDVQKQGSNPKRDPNSIRIFTGHAAHCREVVLGALNCCKDRGWAKGIFANCNTQEKTLGHAKEQGGLVVSVGRYCSAKVLGVCTEHKEGYCLFPSRIAYDIQTYGRHNQLGRGFGDGRHPDCSGLSPSEIGKINFDRIDFSNVIHSVTAKATWPRGSQSESHIEKKIREAIARKSHE